ncbi:MAG: hypothetical protein ACJ71D_03575 [Nitrososphaera sp.]
MDCTRKSFNEFDLCTRMLINGPHGFFTMMNNNRKALALSLSALLILGTTTFTLSRNAYAHTFGGNESAVFLAKVQGLKVVAHLIQSDLSNQTLVAWHSDKIGEF